MISKIDEHRKNEEEISNIPKENQTNNVTENKPDDSIEIEEETAEDFSKDSAELKTEKSSPINRINKKIEQEVEGNIDEGLEVGEVIEEEEVNLDSVQERKAPKKEYQLPSAELLTNPVNVQSGMSRDELVERANFLQQSLETFGVMGKVVNVSPGPVITLFEVEPAEGVRVNKFVALSDDLARVMEASRVRVIAPIPGKSSVGIEIPNLDPDMVYFKSIINSEKFASATSKLAIAVGKTTSGEIATLDLSKMPHLLIAGTTGSGKTMVYFEALKVIIDGTYVDMLKAGIIDPKKVTR